MKKKRSDVTYVNNKKVQPTPVVSEVFFESVSKPFQDHLQNEDIGEDLVSEFQHHLYNPPLVNVDVLEGLQGA